MWPLQLLRQESLFGLRKGDPGRGRIEGMANRIQSKLPSAKQAIMFEIVHSTRRELKSRQQTATRGTAGGGHERSKYLLLQRYYEGPRDLEGDSLWTASSGRLGSPPKFPVSGHPAPIRRIGAGSSDASAIPVKRNPAPPSGLMSASQSPPERPSLAATQRRRVIAAR
jgi:hypothetical protein